MSSILNSVDITVTRLLLLGNLKDCRFFIWIDMGVLAGLVRGVVLAHPKEIYEHISCGMGLWHTKIMTCCLMIQKVL
jgi:hypothetical protein